MEFEFDLENPLDSLDAVPADYRAYFVKGDAGYSIDEKFRPVAAQINGLTKNLKTAKGQVKSARTEAADLRVKSKVVQDLIDGLDVEDKSPDGIKAYLDGLRAAASQAKGADKDAIAAQIASVKKQLTDGFAAQLAEKDGALTKKDRAIHKFLIDSQATAAIADAKGAVPLLMPMIAQRAKVVEEGDNYSVVIIGDDGEAMVDGSGNNLTIAGYIKRLRDDPVMGRAFERETAPNKTATPPGNRRPAAPGGGDVPLTANEKISRGLAARGGKRG